MKPANTPAGHQFSTPETDRDPELFHNMKSLIFKSTASIRDDLETRQNFCFSYGSDWYRYRTFTSSPENRLGFGNLESQSWPNTVPVPYMAGLATLPIYCHLFSLHYRWPPLPERLCPTVTSRPWLTNCFTVARTRCPTPMQNRLRLTSKFHQTEIVHHL